MRRRIKQGRNVYEAVWVVVFLHLATNIRLVRREKNEIIYRTKENTEVDTAMKPWPCAKPILLFIQRLTLPRLFIIYLLLVRLTHKHTL